MKNGLFHRESWEAAAANTGGGGAVFGIVNRRGEDRPSAGIADGFAGILHPDPEARFYVTHPSYEPHILRESEPKEAIPDDRRGEN